MQQRADVPSAHPPTPIVLFFFELLVFLLSMLTLGLGEFVSRGLALGLWLACTAASLVGYLLAHRSLSRAPHPQPPLPRKGEGVGGEGVGPSTALDDRWNRTLFYTWRRTNALLLFGAIVVGGWYWLGAGA